MPKTDIETLVFLRLKDENLSHLSDQELIDKYLQTKEKLEKIYDESIPKGPIYSFD